MRVRAAVSVLAFCLLASTASLGQEAREEVIPKILAELEAMRGRIDAAEARLRSVEKRRSQAEFLEPSRRNRKRRAPSALYADLSLPPEATLDQAREYVREIKRRDLSKDYYSSTDPEANLLAKVGTKNLSAILDEMGNEESDRFFTPHAVVAVRKLAGDEQAEMVIARLHACPPLARVILDKGWERRARDALFEGLSRSANNLPEEWIKAVVRLRDPRTYGALLAYMQLGFHFELVYNYVVAIEDLPREDLDAAVQAAWDRYCRDPSVPEFMRDSGATVAVRHGHVDALGRLLELLLGNGERRCFTPEETRNLILSLVPIEGTTEELHNWFGRNRDKLAFDRKTGKYFVRER